MELGRVEGLVYDALMLQGLIIGIVVAIALTLYNRYNAKKGAGLAGTIEQVLADGQPRTLAEVAQVVNRNTFLGRGEVAQTLNALHAVGKVRIHPAEPGTPQLKKVDFIRYELIRRD